MLFRWTRGVLVRVDCALELEKLTSQVANGDMEGRARGWPCWEGFGEDGVVVRDVRDALDSAVIIGCGSIGGGRCGSEATGLLNLMTPWYASGALGSELAKEACPWSLVEERRPGS